MKPTMTKLWLDETLLGDTPRVLLRIDWSNDRHHAEMIDGPATPDRVAMALQRLAIMVNADFAERT